MITKQKNNTFLRDLHGGGNNERGNAGQAQLLYSSYLLPSLS